MIADQIYEAMIPQTHRNLMSVAPFGAFEKVERIHVTVIDGDGGKKAEAVLPLERPRPVFANNRGNFTLFEGHPLAEKVINGIAN